MTGSRLLNVLIIASVLLGASLPAVRADHTPPPDLVVIVGTLQSEAGCPGDWQPECEMTALTYDSASDVWTGVILVEPGNDQDSRGSRYKVAINGTWAENYGQGAAQDGPDIPLEVTEPTQVAFIYDHKTHQLTDSVNGDATISAPPEPDQVVIPGTHQSELGCSGDWQADCDLSALTFDEEDGVWQGEFEIQPNNDQDAQGPRYKAALNGGWDVNYGANAQAGGSDIPLVVEAPTRVKFYYDSRTHWVTDNFNQVIAVAMGTFQSELGCASDDDPGCLRSWLQDPGGTGLLTFSTKALPPGNYEVKVAINESNDETYGEGGAPDGDPIPFSIEEGSELFLAYDPQSHELIVSTQGAPRGDLGKAGAHWVTRDTIAWKTPRPEEGTTYALYYAPQGGLSLTPRGVEGGQSIPLKFSLGGLPFTVVQKRPHINGFAPLKIDAADFDKIPEILRSQVAIAALNADGRVLDATGLQIPGVLDDLYRYDGPLGVTFEGGVPTLRVWAPTARSVSLRLYADSTTATDETVPMTLDPATGVWSARGTADWKNRFYLYEVEVYVPLAGTIERNLVTDPYSLSLSTNSQRSQIVDLSDPALMPPGWADLAKPPLAEPEDIVIYELHVRDFSVSDPAVPDDLRGTFKAFTVAGSNGMRHLSALAEAGLTHIHLLPAFDIASVNEDKSTWRSVDPQALAGLPPDSEAQQQAVGNLREQDPFNWGYDPYHYTAPEGSYATDPDGAARVLEFREMVQALNQAGLRVVMDVVYNHTNASGQTEKSVLDRIVPGYYHRLNANGRVETSTCCQNTATEHAMMEKLMLDSLRTWATAYKVDGFRFDLMGHHMRDNMVHVRETLDALRPEVDGVEGYEIYVYGEGWNFGEVADNARGVNATQLNIGGTGVGVFNDRLRDAARGGGPFDDKRLQGFLTGLYTDPSAFAQGSPEDQKARLLRYMDLIRVGLAGNLKGYRLERADGRTVSGEQVDYNGSPAGYTLDPQENIVYVSAHDNEALFDAIQWKAPSGASLADRVRMNNLGLSLVLLAQGVPFFHAGDDLLRSKSLDGNSYNSGDWFNRLDFTYQTNNWAVGLPPFASELWPQMAELLRNPALKPQPADILAAHTHFLEMLRLRKSSPLFRMQTAEDVAARLSFLNTGPDQIPGLIVMRLSDQAEGDLDMNYEEILVAFNANPGPVTFADPDLVGLAYVLHPIQAESADAVVRTAGFDAPAGAITVPGRTAAVFVRLAVTPEPTVTPRARATRPPLPTAPATPTLAPTAAPTVPPSAPTLTPTPAPAPASPVGTVVAVGAVLLAVLAGLFFWRRAAAR